MDRETFDKSEFMGVFYFTNWTDEDYKHLWNNEEYNFPKKSMSPLIMPKEPAESIQEIRKRFAYDLAVREFYKSKKYIKMSKMGNGLPPTFDEKLLEPMIEKCLIPLPVVKAKVNKVVTNEERKFKGTKAVGENDDLNSAFKEETSEGNIKILGKMSDSFVK